MILLGLIIVLGTLLVKYVRLAGYLQGRQDVYNEQTAMPGDGTCYSKTGDCNDRNTKTIKRH